MQPCIVFFLLLFNKFSACIGFYYKFYAFFYYKFIFIEEFIKYNLINYPYCYVTYLDFHFSLGFLNFIFVYCWWICFSIAYTMVIDFYHFVNVFIFFNLTLNFKILLLSFDLFFIAILTHYFYSIFLGLFCVVFFFLWC